MFEERKKQFCIFCKDKELKISYLYPKTLRRYVTDRGKIVPRRYTGVCSKHQRTLSNAIKIAREMALLPYISRSHF